MRKRGGSTLQSELSTANRSDEANRCGEQESGEWKHDHHCDSPNYLRSDHSHYERRRGDAEQGRKYAAAGADEMTSLIMSEQNCRDCSDNLDHESRFIACEKRSDRELARHGKCLLPTRLMRHCSPPSWISCSSTYSSRNGFRILAIRFPRVTVTLSLLPGGSVHGERANFTGLVLGYIEAKFCK